MVSHSTQRNTTTIVPAAPGWWCETLPASGYEVTEVIAWQIEQLPLRPGEESWDRRVWVTPITVHGLSGNTAFREGGPVIPVAPGNRGAL